MLLVLSRWMVSSDAFSTDFHGREYIFCSFWAELRRLEKGGVMVCVPWLSDHHGKKRILAERIKMIQEEGADLK